MFRNVPESSIFRVLSTPEELGELKAQLRLTCQTIAFLSSGTEPEIALVFLIMCKRVLLQFLDVRRAKSLSIHSKHT